MGIILGLLGVGLVIWSFANGIGIREENRRAQIFYGPIGTIVSLGVIGVGLYLAISNFFW